jgi:hypothetical protein
MHDHVHETEPAELQAHLNDAAKTMDVSSLAQLAAALLGGLAKHGTDQTQLQASGISVDAATAGDRETVLALIQHAGTNPQALRAAAVQFIQQNPQMLAQLPGLIQGVLSKL